LVNQQANNKETSDKKLFMKKYSIQLVALAIVFSAFITKPTSTFQFKLKAATDLTSASAIEDKTNWQVTSQSCDELQDLPCNITVDTMYTNGSGISRKLNTSGNTITIASENGFLNTTPDPDVQYRRIACGNNYTFQNKSYQ
jgi:hypothetical protein